MTTIAQEIVAKKLWKFPGGIRSGTSYIVKPVGTYTIQRRRVHVVTCYRCEDGSQLHVYGRGSNHQVSLVPPRQRSASTS